MVFFVHIPPKNSILCSVKNYYFAYEKTSQHRCREAFFVQMNDTFSVQKILSSMSGKISVPTVSNYISFSVAP